MVDFVQIYFDNIVVINLLLGSAIALLVNKFALKKNIHNINQVIDEVEMSLTDDKITVEEQTRIIEKMRELVGEEFTAMLVKVFTD